MCHSLCGGNIGTKLFGGTCQNDGSVQIGQTENLQVDTLLDLGKFMGNQNDSLWAMRNGYALASLEGLQHITQTLTSANSQQYEEMMGQLRIGMHWDTEVTLEHDHHERLLVSQAYCSAMPVAYSRQSSNDWEAFARFVLEGAYEATMLAGVLNAQRDADMGSNKILTLLGGGAFGNRTSWIMDAILRSLRLVEDAGLDVYIVSYGHSNQSTRLISYITHLVDFTTFYWWDTKGPFIHSHSFDMLMIVGTNPVRVWIGKKDVQVDLYLIFEALSVLNLYLVDSLQ